MTGFSFLLHSEHSSHDGIAHFLSEKLGGLGTFIDEVLLHGFLDTLKLVPFLFLTYLLMEFIEHKASDKARMLMTRAGGFGPVIGGTLGAVPQCGFSAAAANLYTGRVITLGTLIAVFLSTSDEMLPILMVGNVRISNIVTIILYKCIVAMAVGVVIDVTMKFLRVERKEINIDEICDNDGCSCERGILPSAIHHTVSVSLFVLAVTVALNLLFFFVSDDAISSSVFSLPVISHLVAALVGLIPNCASSVALSELCVAGVISAGAMMSGLFAGAGVGVLVLLKMNKHTRENALIVGILLGAGVLFGLLADLIGISIV